MCAHTFQNIVASSADYKNEALLKNAPLLSCSWPYALSQGI